MRIFCFLGKATFAACMMLALAGPQKLQAADEAKAVDDYNFAVWLFNNAKYPMAAEAYQKFLANYAAHEKAPDARFGLGQAFFHQGKFKEAAGQYETLRKQHPDFAQMPEMLFQLGQTRVGLEEYAEAVKVFAGLRSSFPDHYLSDWALARQGTCLVIHRKPADALPLLQTFLEKYEKPAKPGRKSKATEDMLQQLAQANLQANDVFLDLIERTSFYAALALFNQDNFKEARESFDDFQSRYPKSKLMDEAQFRKAQAIYRQNAFAQAAEAYKSVADGKSDFAETAAFERGLAFHKAAKLREASAAFAEMATRFPNSPHALKAALYAGTLLFDAGDYGAAVKRLTPLCKEKEIADQAAYWLGMSLLKSGKYTEAENLLADSIKTYQKSALMADMNLGLADAKLALNKLEDAAAAFREYARLSKGSDQAPHALYSAATALHRAEKYEDSEKICSEFMGIYSKHELTPQLLFLSAENRFLQKEYDKAAARHKELLVRSDIPKDLASLTHFRAAWIHRYAKRYAEALLELAKADDAAGPSMAAEACYLKGICLFDQQNFEEAASVLEAYMRSADTSSFGDDALFKLGIARAKQGQSKTAMESFVQLLKDYPGSSLAPQALYQLAELCFEAKEYDKAVEYYAKAVEQQPKSELAPYALFGQALCLYETGQLALSAKILSRFPEEYKTSDLLPQALYRQGLCLLKLKKWDEAKTVFLELSSTMPKHELARSATVLAGTCLQEQKKWAEAAKLFHTAIDSFAPDKDQPRLLYELAWSYREAGNEAESVAAFQSLADKYASDPLAADALFHLAETKYKAPDKPEQPNETAQRLKIARILYVRSLNAAQDKRLEDKILYRVGWCDWLSEKYASAADVFDRLWREHGESELAPDALFHAGQAYARIEAHETAVQRFKELLDNPRYARFKFLPEAGFGLGEAEFALNQQDEAEKILSVWIKDNPDHSAVAQARFILGRVKYDKKDYSSALENFAAIPSLTHSELAAQAQFYSGQVFHAQGKLKEAVMAYLRVQALYPDVAEWNAAALFEKAKCLEILEESDEAAAAYAEILKKYKDTKWAEMAADRLK